DKKMVMAFFKAAVLGPRTRAEVRQLVTSVRVGQDAAQRVTPTPRQTIAISLETEPVITPLPGNVSGLVIVPDSWLETVCSSCDITYYHPAFWELLREESDHHLWQAPGGGLVVVGTALAPCQMTGDDN